jgi:signal recognition particle subunit SRP54
MPAVPGAGQRGKTKAQPKKDKGTRTSGTPAKAAQPAAAQKAAAAERPANAFGDADEVDYEKAAAALDLPKDFSKFLK